VAGGQLVGVVRVRTRHHLAMRFDEAA
jgi:hypothetical protein